MARWRAPTWVAWCLFGAVVAINTVLSLTTWAVDWWREQADPATSSLPKLLEPVLEARAGTSDADAHLFLWSAVTFVLWWAIRSATRRIRLVSFAGLWTYTAGLELAQHWVPKRSPQWIDLVGNGLGIAAGITAGYLISRLFGSAGTEQSEAEPVDGERQAAS